MNILSNFCGFFASAAAEPVEEVSALSSIVTIIVAIIVAFLALKILKHTAKAIFVTAVVVAVILLVTGVIDFAMVKSAGYTIWDWLLKTDLYHEITGKLG